MNSLSGALSELEIDQLAAHLAHLTNPDALSLEGVDGLFCALIASPDLVSPSDYLPVILGGDFGNSQEFADLADANATMSLLMRHWNLVIADFKRESIHFRHVGPFFRSSPMKRMQFHG
jgi:yecA family protein